MKKELKKYEEVFTMKNFRFIVVIITVAAAIITIINNLEIDSYIKDFIMPFIILVSTFIILLEKLSLAKNRKAYLYLIPIALSLISYLFIKIDDNNMFLNILFIPMLISIFLYTLVNKEYSLSKSFIGDFFGLFPDYLISNLRYIQLVKKGNNKEKSKNGFNIFIGCLIGFPIAIVLISLLTDADKYFKEFIETIFVFMKRIINIQYFIPNTILIAVSFVIMFSVFVNLLRRRNKEQNEIKERKVNNSIASTVLIIINSVFVLFLISEISKFTVNFLRLPIEYTYSGYAREGFFQLLFVTVINISIILYFVYFTTAIKENKLLKKLLVTLSIFSILLICSSYYRVVLYICAYTFTILRAQVILFLVMELLVFGVITNKILKGISNKDSIVYMIIIVSIYIFNLYICTEPFIKFINSIL